MQLENARNLKLDFQKELVNATTSASAIRAMGIRAQKSSTHKEVLRSIALGISQKGKEHRLAVRIQRRSLESHPIVEKMKKQSKGEIDIKFVGKIQKLETPSTLQKRRRPLVIGCSIGHFKITAGTLGCFVVDRATREILILSNNHVLANEGDAAVGDSILQQGKFDGGTVAKNKVGTLSRYIKLKETAINLVDCATSTIDSGIKQRKLKLGSFGDLAGLGADVSTGTVVHKVGRTTGETTGKVTAFELDNVVVAYDIGNIRFDNQIEIEGAGNESFSAGGDSGSLIFDDALGAVALLFAGGDVGGSNGKGLTFANPIRNVLDALKVDLLI